MYALYFYVPETHCESVKAALFAAGAGKIGNYDSCAWQTSGLGQYRPLDNSTPYLGQQGQIETVAEIKVEIVCADKTIKEVIAALKKAHPYETPAYGCWKLLDL